MNPDELNQAQVIEFTDQRLETELPAWIQLCPGEFTVDDVYRHFDVKGKVDKSLFILELEIMVAKGLIQRSGKRRGRYKPCQLDCKPINFDEVDDRPLNIFMPLDIGKLVNLYSGNIVTIAGEKNSGKSAFLLNLARGNRDGYKVHYFNSEMGPPELLARLKKFEAEQMPLEEWKKISFYERATDFAEVIKPGLGNINIIDFLEVHDEFYRMGGYIREIFDALRGAIAIVAIQKNPGQEDGIGGRRTTEKSRLHIAMSPGECKIVVGKNWRNPEINPNGLKCKFKLVQGFNFIPQHIDGCIWAR